MSVETSPIVEQYRHTIDVSHVGNSAIGASMLAHQIEAWAGYRDTVMIDPVEANFPLSTQAIIERFETDHVVRRAPHFNDQRKDRSRVNIIQYADAEPPFNNVPHMPITEYKALKKLNRYLSDLQTIPAGEEIHAISNELRENLTFIGEKELKEAAQGIAVYWKNLLEKNPHQQILTPTGYIDKLYSDKSGLSPEVKSNDYVLDAILAEFSDDELSRYSGRLITDVADVSVDIDNLKTIFVDDWMVSGKQMKWSMAKFADEHEELIPTLEVQLVAGSEADITLGLVDKEEDDSQYFGVNGESDRDAIPVRAYFLAHKSSPFLETDRDIRITGAHSAVDFGFKDVIGDIFTDIDTGELNDQLVEWLTGDITRKEEAAYNNITGITPLTHLLPPYRQKGYRSVHIERLHAVMNLS